MSDIKVSMRADNLKDIFALIHKTWFELGCVPIGTVTKGNVLIEFTDNPAEDASNYLMDTVEEDLVNLFGKDTGKELVECLYALSGDYPCDVEDAKSNEWVVIHIDTDIVIKFTKIEETKNV